MIHNSRFIIRKANGIAALPTVVIIAAIALLVGLAILGSGIIDAFLSSAQKESTDAFYIAEAGIKDALERLTRNPGFSNAGYTLNLGANSNQPNITATQDNDCSVSASGRVCIVSDSRVVNRRRKIQVVVNLNTCFGGTNNGNSCASGADCLGGGACVKAGKITPVSWQELTQ